MKNYEVTYEISTLYRKIYTANSPAEAEELWRTDGLIDDWDEESEPEVTFVSADEVGIQ